MTDPPHPVRIDHLGLPLTRAAQAWRRLLTEGMRARGVDWYGEARAALIPLVGPEGVRQADLAARSGLTRQAVQQFLEALERDGIVARGVDPDDRRALLVRFTARGAAVLATANAVKAEIDAAYAALLGARKVAVLRAALERVAAHEPPPPAAEGAQSP